MRKKMVILVGILFLVSIFMPMIRALTVTQNVTVIVLSETLKVYSPVLGKIYPDRAISINISMDIKAKYLEYSDNGSRLILLCRNCDKYSRVTSFSEGLHNITFIGILSDGQNVTSTASFFIDSKDPQISVTEPRNREFTNGSDFNIKYTEENLQSVILFYGLSKVERNDCDKGRNKNCSFNLDLSAYDGKSIVYSFKLVDIANNTKSSRNTTVIVDTTSPSISQFNLTVSRNYATFNISINESNFYKVNYIDLNDSKPRWNTLCSSLRQGNCVVKKYFREGNHSITIRVLDKAGNSAQKLINFSIL